MTEYDPQYKEADRHGLNGVEIGKGDIPLPEYDPQYKEADRHGLNGVEIGRGDIPLPEYDPQYKEADRHGLNGVEIGRGDIPLPEYDPQYKEADRHGLSGVEIGRGDISLPEYDPQYKEADRHGLTGVEIGRGDISLPEYDPQYKEADRHGLTGVEIGRGDISLPEYDPQYKAADRHGLTGVEIGRGDIALPEYDPQYKEVDRHGLTGVSFPDRDVFDTQNEEDIKLGQNFVLASSITPEGYNVMISKFSPKAIKNIVELRFKKSAGKLINCNGFIDDELSKAIACDISIIANAISNNVNLFDESFNTSILSGGEDNRDVIGLLDAYKEYMNLGKVKPYCIVSDPITRENVKATNPVNQKPLLMEEYIDNVEEIAVAKKEEIGNNMNI